MSMEIPSPVLQGGKEPQWFETQVVQEGLSGYRHSLLVYKIRHLPAGSFSPFFQILGWKYSQGDEEQPRWNAWSGTGCEAFRADCPRHSHAISACSLILVPFQDAQGLGLSQGFTSQMLPRWGHPWRRPEVAATVLSWLGISFKRDLGKATAGTLEGRSCPAMGLLSVPEESSFLCAWFLYPHFTSEEASFLCLVHLKTSGTMNMENWSRNLISDGTI